MKKYPLYFSLLITLYTVFNTAWATQSILLLGDSVSAGYQMSPEESWAYLLNERLEDEKAPYRLINASISGETTSGGLSRLPAILANEKVDHLLIELGGNDGLRGYAPKRIKSNLLQMISMAQERDIKVSLIKIKITPNYGPRYLALFEKVYDDIAEETGVTLFPFFMEKIAQDPNLMMADGIHPNKEAQPLIATYVGEQLKQMMN
ncbi:arylesterase [Thalassotalea piscium]|uniref:Acyl-CoA thioesterase-1 n=1 Tax=Thalassotalea piscium TaxID=1230533 RepID=A0A7X0TVD0_9GAMM|nr:arylesterase [Thalassotalea piscium]MBB6545039.1 acyl-CoA thioesterase-1 [Thalassotalea piscium]